MKKQARGKSAVLSGVTRCMVFTRRPLSHLGLVLALYSVRAGIVRPSDQTVHRFSELVVRDLDLVIRVLEVLVVEDAVQVEHRAAVARSV